LKYKNTRTHVIVVLRVTQHFMQAAADPLSHQGHCIMMLASGVSLPGMRSGRVWHHGRHTVRGHPKAHTFRWPLSP